MTNQLNSMNNQLNSIFHLGIVSNNTEKKGHIKVCFTHHYYKNNHNKKVESGWIKVASATNGFYFMPELDQQVVIIFPNGDSQEPIVLGTLWNEKYPLINKLRTRSGHEMTFDDSDGKEKICIKDKAGSLLEFDTSSKCIQIYAETNISIKSKNITLDASDGELVLKGKIVKIN